ncbi:Hypothetical protein A7982_02718 [Minicystis rosea]|nr:Hypothetical protein A7982_02718 [Minicystis rosea]
MIEPNRLRLEQMAARYQARLDAATAVRAGDETAFLREFAEACDNVVRPVMEECAGVLRASGHEPRILVDEGFILPSIELALGLRGASGTSNRVGFGVIRRERQPLKILSYLVMSPPQFDMDRFARAAELTADRVEYIVVEAIEQLMATNTPSGSP